MVDQRLVDYIKFELSRGTSLQQIKQDLLSQGWSDYDVDEAVSLATQRRTLPNEEPVRKFSKLWIISILIVIVVSGGVFAFFMLGERETPVETKLPKC